MQPPDIIQAAFPWDAPIGSSVGKLCPDGSVVQEQTPCPGGEVWTPLHRLRYAWRETTPEAKIAIVATVALLVYLLFIKRYS